MPGECVGGQFDSLMTASRDGPALLTERERRRLTITQKPLDKGT